MNAHKPIPAAVPLRSTAGVVSSPPLGAAPATLCPDCNGPFSDRIRDEDTGCFYPVDPGEHYCDTCDAIWSDDALSLSGWALSEQAALRREM